MHYDPYIAFFFVLANASIDMLRKYIDLFLQINRYILVYTKNRRILVSVGPLQEFPHTLQCFYLKKICSGGFGVILVEVPLIPKTDGFFLLSWFQYSRSNDVKGHYRK